MYDPLALLACCSRTLHTFGDPEVKVVATDEDVLRAILSEGTGHEAKEGCKAKLEHAVLLEQEHLVLGTMGNSKGTGDGHNDGIRDVQAVRDFLMNGARYALLSSMTFTKAFRTGSFLGTSTREQQEEQQQPKQQRPSQQQLTGN